MRAELQVQIIHAALNTLRDADVIQQSDVAEMTKCLSLAINNETVEQRKERSNALMRTQIAKRNGAFVRSKILREQQDADDMSRLISDWQVGDEAIFIRRTIR